MLLGSLQGLYAEKGPFVSAHVDVSRDTEDARQQLTSRLTTLRHELEHDGVDEKTITALTDRIAEQTSVPGEVHRYLVAADGRVVFDDVRGGHSSYPESCSVGPLPDLAAWVHQVDGETSFLLVVADREGADLDLYRAASHPEVEHREVEGDTFHITKVHVGDWAERSYLQGVEEKWKHNAREVAEEIRHVCRSERPRVVVVAGEVRARAELREALDGLSVEVEEIESGGRAAGTSDEAMWTDVRRVLAALEADDERRLTEQLAEATGRGTGVAQGLEEVLDAFVQGKVERLVLDLDATRDARVSAERRAGLALPTSAAEDTDLPADQLLVALAAATGAEVSLLARDQSGVDPATALLRWDDATSSAPESEATV